MSTHCPECGHTFHSSDATEAQSRIQDLETQVRLLNTKAAAYVDKLADYEDEIRALRTQCAKLQNEKDQNISIAPLSAVSATKEDAPLPPPPPLPAKDDMPQAQTNRQSLSRLSSLTSYLPGRRKDTGPPPVPPLTPALNQSTPNLATPSSEYGRSPAFPPYATDPMRGIPSVTLISLQTSLETERHLRQQAETNLAQSQTELEELTAQLFGQANEMVAEERKARAKLEERVKLLETRDGDKRRRLERLEKAVDRIDRVRRMVVQHEKEMGDDAYIEVAVPQVTRRDSKKMPVTRHTRRMHSRDRRSNGYGGVNGKSRPEIVSEDEEEDIVKKGTTARRASSVEEDAYEFDVQLKVWRRSRANLWRTPSFD